jgi:hypothetical protein
MKDVQVTANEMRNGEILVKSDTRATQLLDHVLHQPQAAVSVQREDRFGMKLNGFDRQIAMADAHDDAVVAFRGYFQARREFFGNRV